MRLNLWAGHEVLCVRVCLIIDLLLHSEVGVCGLHEYKQTMQGDCIHVYLHIAPDHHIARSNMRKPFSNCEKGCEAVQWSHLILKMGVK